MNYLTDKADIEPGAILKVYVNERFEGWARLLDKAKQRYDTFIDNNIVYVRERWRIQFIEPELVPKDMNANELWNQRSLQGVITHRYFVYFGERTWELYIAKYGLPTDIPADSRMDEMSDMDIEFEDDENFIF